MLLLFCVIITCDLTLNTPNTMFCRNCEIKAVYVFMIDFCLCTQVGCHSNRPPGYVLESMARVVVEVIKRTWPQFWPTLQEDLQAIGQQVNTALQ